ncbi:ATP-binding protein [Fusibacter sp. 3D3]|uniref:ATP-binding protein n=1 Tax=Fusibacter sp. 3D3 TaxID=1048380 RepID=UPI00085310B8|nr:ATP-binding protein [Fusibacter sp. 3D3]GAU79165.1 sensor histidine kinase [Fusibacter sp. 3D3]
MAYGRQKPDLEMLFIAGMVSFCSLFFFNFFVEGFIITISVIAMPVLLYWYEEVNPIKVGIMIAIASPFFRMFTLLLSHISLEEAFQVIWPEIFFYITYSILFNALYVKRDRKLNDLVIAVFLSDFISNIVEMSLRLQTLGISLSVFRGLAIIALVRTMIIIVMVIVVKQFRTLVVREAHERHYHYLLMMTSNFWSEIYFMEKNINYIEALMAKAFKLYHKAESSQADPEIVAIALDVAKEVHEVKKDYIRVIQGLEAITEKKLYDLEMGIHEIVKVVITNTHKCYKEKEPNIHLIENVKSQACVKYHFYMTSILRNLIGNAIEAFDKEDHGYVRIDVFEEAEALFMEISDDGKGIKSRDFPFIFNPGFSSKYASDSGDIQRGMGLSVVKGLVENVFLGTIKVESTENVGTKFTINISLKNLSGGAI